MLRFTCQIHNHTPFSVHGNAQIQQIHKEHYEIEVQENRVRKQRNINKQLNIVNEKQGMKYGAQFY